MDKLKKAAPFLIPPLFIMILCGTVFAMNGLYPFGEGTVAWCDMSQQVIPLLCDFKDVLDGKDSLFLNMHNAAGMNFWGVFFFFIASPFSLLVKFVDKTEMVHFVNILTVLKMMTAAFTAYLYFRRCHKNLKWYYSDILSAAYALCGYTMLFYQNNIWLDMMYIFPLLLISFDKLIREKKILMYVLVMTSFVIVNYYISYMVVASVLLTMALICIIIRKKSEYKDAPANFILGSMIAVLLSCVVWLPCLIQFLSSGRTRSITETLKESEFLTGYETVIPMLMASTTVFVLILIYMADLRKKCRPCIQLKCSLIMLFLMCVPLVIEPVNIMWHTGNYMSFPARYGFITIFFALVSAGYFLEERNADKKAYKYVDSVSILIICMVAVGVSCMFSIKTVRENLNDITHYVSSLWGNETSFALILKITIIMAASVLLFTILHKLGLISKEVFAVFLAVSVTIEGINSMDIYMTASNYRNPNKVPAFQNVSKLANKIEDDNFYRVSTESKLFDVNMCGGLGYNSIGHYTSLTNRDYMFTMKEMGYSSYWMEVGTYGGTEITDAIMSVKYNIGRRKASVDNNYIYVDNSFQITQNETALPLGIIRNGDFNYLSDLSFYERSDVQELLYENVLGGDKNDPVITKYQYVQDISRIGNNSYRFEKNGDDLSLFYQCDVNGRQSLYFDCFDKLSTNLSEPINSSVMVIVNGETKQSDYPSGSSNGLLKLGEFENEKVSVIIRFNKSLVCRSFGVFGVDLDKLSNKIQSVKTADLKADNGRISGECQAVSGEKCIVSVPYQDSFTVKVNGKKVGYEKCFGDFLCFALENGQNKIEITFTPKGFKVGLAVTLAGIIALALYIRFGKKIKFPLWLCKVSSFLLIFLGAGIIAGFYILPVVINLT